VASSLPAEVPERFNQRCDWKKRFMFNDVLRGSRVAFIVWALSLFCLYVRLVPPYYFAAVLAAWTLYSLCRVSALFVKRSVTSSTDHSRRNALAYWLGAVGSSLLAPLPWMLVVSHAGTVWVSANEAVAVGKLRDLNHFQRQDAADHPEKGFACALSLVEYAEPPNRSGRDMTRTQSGYNFAIINCRLAKGTVIHYQATAVPTRQGTTGFRPFCTDDSGEIWYDGSGSASKLSRVVRQKPARF
jgi:hypothetical protein